MEDESTGPSAKQKNAGEVDKEDGSSDEDDDFNPTLAAMETEIKPKVLKTVSTLTKEYNKWLNDKSQMAIKGMGKLKKGTGKTKMIGIF